MSYPKGYALDRDGHFIPPSGIKIVREASFGVGLATDNSAPALPSWLKTDTGNGYETIAGVSNQGCYNVRTADAVSGTVARFATSKIPLSQCAAVMFEVGGLFWRDSYVATHAADVVLGLRNFDSGDPAAGAAWIQNFGNGSDGNPESSKIAVAGESAANATLVGYDMTAYGESFRKRNIGILILPPTKQVLVFEDSPDNIVGWKDATAMGTGLVRGYLQLTNREAAQNTIRFSSVKLTVWRNYAF